MDDKWIIGGFYFAAVFSFGVASTFVSQALRCRKQIWDLEQQSHVYSLEDLSRLNSEHSVHEKKVLNGKRNVLVSGILLRDNEIDTKHDGIDKVNQHLYRQIGQG